MSSATAPARASERASTTRPGGWLGRFDSPVTTYYLLVCVTVALVVFGLIMVLSASSIVSHRARRDSAYSIFLSQAVFAAVGAVALVVASRLSVPAWKRLALPILAVAFVLQLLVLTPMGVNVNGNQNWLRLGPVTVQPSEIIKVGLVLAGGLILAAKRKHLHSLSHVLVPYLVPIAAVSIGVVVLGHDLGTVLILGAIVAGVLFAAGIPLRWFAFAGVPFVAMAIAFVVTSPNRLGRFDVWLGPRHQRVRRRPPADPRPLRPRRRRLVRPRPRGQPREVGPALRAAQRLHLRDHRRGARAARHPRRPRCSSPAWPWPATASSRAPTTSSCGSRRPAS